MALPRLETVLNAISSLANTIRGQATAVKAAFEHDPNVIKDYINDELLPAIENDFATEEDLQALVIGEFGTNFVTEEMMANEMKKSIAGGVAAYDAFNTHISENSSEADMGHIQLSTIAEAKEGTNTSKAVTPSGLSAAITDEVLTSITTGLAANWTGTIRARKELSNVVVLNLALTKSVDFSAGVETIYTLPEGLRPKNDVMVTLNAFNSSGTSISGSFINIIVNALGAISLYPVAGTTLTNARTINNMCIVYFAS